MYHTQHHAAPEAVLRSPWEGARPPTLLVVVGHSGVLLLWHVVPYMVPLLCMLRQA